MQEKNENFNMHENVKQKKKNELDELERNASEIDLNWVLQVSLEFHQFCISNDFFSVEHFLELNIVVCGFIATSFDENSLSLL